MVYVKTTYGEKSMRLPNISKYPTKEDADSIIKACLKWGINIASCEIIDTDEAKRLIVDNAAEADREIYKIFGIARR